MGRHLNCRDTFTAEKEHKNERNEHDECPRIKLVICGDSALLSHNDLRLAAEDPGTREAECILLLYLQGRR